MRIDFYKENIPNITLWSIAAFASDEAVVIVTSSGGKNYVSQVKICLGFKWTGLWYSHTLQTEKINFKLLYTCDKWQQQNK